MYKFKYAVTSLYAQSPVRTCIVSQDSEKPVGCRGFRVSERPCGGKVGLETLVPAVCRLDTILEREVGRTLVSDTGGNIAMSAAATCKLSVYSGIMRS